MFHKILAHLLVLFEEEIENSNRLISLIHTMSVYYRTILWLAALLGLLLSHLYLIPERFLIIFLMIGSSYFCYEDSVWPNRVRCSTQVGLLNKIKSAIF